MKKLNKHQVEDILFDNALDHLERLKECRHLNEKSKIATEVYFYNKDILEILEESKNHIPDDDLEEIMNDIRETFNFYQYII